MITFTSTILLLPLLQLASPTPTVQAPWGTIQGVRVKGDGGREMEGYYGIPYAVPPVGDLRFEKPQPHPGPEQGQLFVADQIMPACPQMKPGLIGMAREMSEDCLKLNVFVPVGDPPPSLYPVMVFIHGGSFTYGESTTYRPSRLVADGKVIVVVIQYRLGFFGFFTSGDDILPGNLGLWDQNLALQWIQNNIRAFQGDAKLVTLFGESAGSASSGMQMFSPYSRGLFKRVIMQSGSPAMADSLTYAFDYRAVFKSVAGLFQCPGDSSKEWLACLKQQSMEELESKTTQFAATSPLGGSMFFPRIDGDFLPRPLKELARDERYVEENGLRDIEVMMGFTNKEGSIVLFMLMLGGQPFEALYSPQFYELLIDLGFVNTGGPVGNEVVKKAVDFFYRRADMDTAKPVPMDVVTNLYGDCIMAAPTVEWMRHLAALSPHPATSFPHYLYVLDHDFSFNQHSLVPGAHHGDDIFLQFDNEDMNMFPPDSLFSLLNKTTLREEEEPLSRMFVNLVTTFARTGNPNYLALRDELGGDWPEFTSENEAYLSISRSPSVMTDLGPYRDRMALWLHLVPKLTALTSQKASEVKDEGQQQQAMKDEL